MLSCQWLDVYLFYLLFQPKLIQSLIFPPRFWAIYGGYLPSYWVRLRSLDEARDRCSVAVSNLPLGGYWSDWTDIKALPEGLTATLLTPLWAADIGAYTIGKFFGRTAFLTSAPKRL